MMTNEMFNVNVTENVLTKYKDLVVQHRSSQSISSRGQWSSQSPAPPCLQHFCAVQPSLAIIVIPSSSNQEDLQDNDPLFIDI